MRSIVFTNSSGASVTLNSSGADYFITSIEGIDTPPVDSQTQKAPYQDGVTNIDQLFGVRDITIEGFVRTPVDLTIINTSRRTLQSVLNPKLGLGNIVYTYDGGTKQIAAKCIACTFANRNMPDPWQKFQVIFECPDPYLLSTTTDATSVGLVSALTKFPTSFPEGSVSATFYSSGAPVEGWYKITSDISGNLWAVGTSYISYCPAGSTVFTQLTSSGAHSWFGISSDIYGNIWATANGDDIYKCNAGGTTFTGLSVGAKTWYGITCDKYGNVWAVSYGDDVYKCNSGGTTFTGLSAGALNWFDITSDLDGNVWAEVTNGGDIYKCNTGSTTFVGIGTTGNNWRCITSDPSGNIWAAEISGKVYKCNYNSLTFTQLPFSNGAYSITSDPSGNIWAASVAYGLSMCPYGSTVFSQIASVPGNSRGVTSTGLGEIWVTVNSGTIYYAPIVGTYIFSEVSSSSSRIITNSGDVPEPIIATLYGPAVNPTLINTTTGEFIHLLYTLASGESLQINTAFGNKTITLNAGGSSTNGLQYLDPLSTFFQLQVGDNLMNLYDDTGSSQLRCDIGKIDRYVGI